MNLIILLLATFSVHAMSEQIIDFRELKDRGPKITREMYKRKVDYRVRLTKENSKLTMREATPLFTLTEFANCVKKELVPLRTSSQFEPTHIEAFHRCGSKESLEDWKKRNALEEICRGRNIQSDAQEILCKELGLYK